MEGYINVTGIDIRKLVAAAYDESRPVGLGTLHFEPGPLPEEEVEQIVGSMKVQGKGCCLDVDYVKGRAVKLGVFRDIQGRLWIPKSWHDHSEIQLFRALRKAGWVSDNFNRDQVKGFMMSVLAMTPCTMDIAEKLIDKVFQDYDSPGSVIRMTIRSMATQEASNEQG